MDGIRRRNTHLERRALKALRGGRRLDMSSPSSSWRGTGGARFILMVGRGDRRRLLETIGRGADIRGGDHLRAP